MKQKQKNKKKPHQTIPKSHILVRTVLCTCLPFLFFIYLLLFVSYNIRYDMLTCDSKSYSQHIIILRFNELSRFFTFLSLFNLCFADGNTLVNSTSNTKKVIIPIALAVGVILLGAFCWLLRRMLKRKSKWTYELSFHTCKNMHGNWHSNFWEFNFVYLFIYFRLQEYPWYFTQLN